MNLLAFLAACGIGAVVCLLTRPSGRIGRLAALVALLAAFVAALFIGPGTRLAVGDVTLSGSDYARLFLAAAAGSGLVLSVVALASGWADEFAPAALASFAGLGVALTAAEPGVSLAAGAAAATAGALVVVPAATWRPGDDGRLAEIRTIGLVAAALLFAGLALLRPAWNAASAAPVFVLAYFGLAVALAVRSGAVPFHVPAARLRRSAVAMAPALLLVWLPAGFGILALSWSATTFGIRSDWLARGGALVQVVAVATILLGALAALVHEDLEEIVGYSIVADAGFILLALAARTDAAAEPARLWLLAFVAAKTGFVAWSAAVGRAFGTSNVDRLHGWLRRTPLLGLALVLIGLATLGWPGGAVYQARSSLIRLALPDALQLLFAAAIVLSVAYYARLLVVGLLSPTDQVRSARSELPRWSEASAGPQDAVAVTATMPGRTEANARARTILDAPATRAEAAPAPTPGIGRRLAGIWRLNRTVEVSIVVLAGAALATAVAFGGLGANHAAGSGIPLDTAAHATAPPTPRPTPSPTVTPLPTIAPIPTPSPSGSAGPSASPSDSTTPAA